MKCPLLNVKRKRSKSNEHNNNLLYIIIGCIVYAIWYVSRLNEHYLLIQFFIAPSKLLHPLWAVLCCVVCVCVFDSTWYWLWFWFGAKAYCVLYVSIHAKTVNNLIRIAQMSSKWENVARNKRKEMSSSNSNNAKWTIKRKEKNICINSVTLCAVLYVWCLFFLLHLSFSFCAESLHVCCSLGDHRPNKRTMFCYTCIVMYSMHDRVKRFFFCSNRKYIGIFIFFIHYQNLSPVSFEVLCIDFVDVGKISLNESIDKNFVVGFTAWKSIKKEKRFH